VYSVQRVCVCAVAYRVGRGDAQLYNIISVNARRVIDTKPTAPAAHGPCQIRTKGTLTPSFISVYVIIIHSCTFRLYYTYIYIYIAVAVAAYTGCIISPGCTTVFLVTLLHRRQILFSSTHGHTAIMRSNATNAKSLKRDFRKLSEIVILWVIEVSKKLFFSMFT